jgi:hypothetical protein
MRVEPQPKERVSEPGTRWRAVAVYGVAIGVLTAFAAHALPPSARAMAVLPVLLSTLIAGRCASLRAAMVHGALAWAVVVVGTDGLRTAPSPPPHAAVVWISLLLIEDMALLGRLTAVCRRRAYQRPSR